ncbi:MAG: hypothetical protein ACE5G8_12650 [Anaerolineae bacterium]
MTLFGVTFWRAVRYGRRLFRQPRLLPRPTPPLEEGRDVFEAAAARIAAANLRAGIERRRLSNGAEKLVLCAGVRNFREPWARDFGFASFGLVELGEFDVTRDCLEAFLINQRPSGQFPVKIHSTNFLDRYLHSLFNREQPTDAPIKPKYVTAHNTVSLDGNALLIIALLNYAHRRNDRAFVRAHWGALKRALFWLQRHAPDSDGLLHQLPFADWADSVARAGRVLYTNVLYWKALHDLAQAAAAHNFSADGRYFERQGAHIKESINNYFWRADLGYYVTSQVFDNLSSSGNLLAVAWGMASPQQAHSILDKMDEFNMARPVPTQVVHHTYPKRFIALENRLGGIGHYHTTAAWLWLGAWHVIALTRMERLSEAEELLFRIARVIIRDGAVHEVYDPGGHYLSTLWYTSEAPLTWSAGMVAHAYHVYQRWLQGQPIYTLP